MVFGASVALSGIQFLALFPIALLWLRRAWRILVRLDRRPDFCAGVAVHRDL